MADRFDILMDDRHFVEISGHIMRGSADHFDTSRMRLMIGLCAFEPGEKTVMNVYTAA